MIPVILAGGTGSRLWPLSRTLYPKQFMTLQGNQSMLQATLKRLEGLPIRPAMIITNEEHRFIVAEQIRRIGEQLSALILEPFGRNTAPAVALAALESLNIEEDPTLLVMPADHVIGDIQNFQKAVKIAEKSAETGKLVTFGILPTEPETGYGYIRAEGLTAGEQEKDGTSYPVAEFVEKPDLDTARKYLQSGDYFWNSGMFLFKAKRYLEELGTFQPKILKACSAAMQQTSQDLEFHRIDESEFEA